VPVAEPAPAVESVAPETVPVAEPVPEAEAAAPVAEPLAEAAPEAVAAASAAEPAPAVESVAPETVPVAEPVPEAEAAAPEAAQAPSALALPSLKTIVELALAQRPLRLAHELPVAESPAPAVEAAAPESVPAAEAAAPETVPPTPAAEPLIEPALSDAPVAAAVRAPDLTEPMRVSPEVEAAPTIPVPAVHLQAHWLLSLFTPAAADAVDWGRGSYTVLARGGRIDSPSPGSGDLKKQIQMVAEGSVLYVDGVPLGAAADVAPDGFAHPVFRAGFALAIPLPEVH
jgi:hypothetical protein